MVQVIGSVFWLLVIPFCIGLIPANFISKNRKTPGVVLLAGYLFMWAVFEVIAVPAVLWILYDNFLFVLRWFTAAAIFLATLGVWLQFRMGKPRFRLSDILRKKLSMEAKIEWLLFFGFVGFQLYMAVTRTSFDGDDAFYVVHSLMAQQSGAMYRNNPYTGWSTTLDIRHALAVFPIWVAFVAVKADLHATIVSHAIMPLVLIPLTYLIFYEIAKELFTKEIFPSRKENIPVFMIIMGMFQLFGNVSIYTNETFFLTRTWQGKSVVGNFVIPMTFLLILWIYHEKTEKRNREAGLWFLLVCLNITAGFSSSLAVFLLTILLAIMAVCLMVVERDIKISVKLGLTCIPNAIYVLIYLGLLD